jgi:hypothetical protein
MSLNHTRSIASQIEGAAEHVNQSWKASPKPPPDRLSRNQRGKQKSVSVPSLISRTMPSRPINHQAQASAWSPERHSPDAQEHGASQANSQPEANDWSPGSEAQTTDPFASLSNRGKGHHVCPWGSSCTKGGVGSDGELVVFERNSKFRLVAFATSPALQLQ